MDNARQTVSGKHWAVYQRDLAELGVRQLSEIARAEAESQLELELSEIILQSGIVNLFHEAERQGEEYVEGFMKGVCLGLELSKSVYGKIVASARELSERHEKEREELKRKWGLA